MPSWNNLRRDFERTGDFFMKKSGCKKLSLPVIQKNNSRRNRLLRYLWYHRKLLFLLKVVFWMAGLISKLINLIEG
jgi:hypothetical protein